MINGQIGNVSEREKGISKFIMAGCSSFRLQSFPKEQLLKHDFARFSDV